MAYVMPPTLTLVRQKSPHIEKNHIEDENLEAGSGVNSGTSLQKQTKVCSTKLFSKAFSRTAYTTDYETVIASAAKQSPSWFELYAETASSLAVT